MKVTVTLPSTPEPLGASGHITYHAVSGGGTDTAESPASYMISIEACKWQKDLNQISMPWDKRFPTRITIHNPKSGKQRIYTVISIHDPRFDQDGWDGIQMVYKTDEPTNKAEYLVLYYSYT